MKLNKNQTIDGEITRIVEEASFVNVGVGRDVVIPKIDLDQVKGDPSINLEVGKTVPVYIYHVPRNGGNPLGSIARAIKTSYSPSQIQNKNSDPWVVIEQKFQVGDVVEGKVKNIKRYGAFIELSTGVVGLVHVSEMDIDSGGSPWNVVSPGEVIKVRILRIEAQKKRIGLSLKDVVSCNGGNI
ncbi:MAG: S1 RNA-binding domain-containing protein [Anaerolineales bacterium]